jgi:hypothetical protein
MRSLLNEGKSSRGFTASMVVRREAPMIANIKFTMHTCTTFPDPYQITYSYPFLVFRNNLGASSLPGDRYA